MSIHAIPAIFIIVFVLFYALLLFCLFGFVLLCSVSFFVWLVAWVVCLFVAGCRCLGWGRREVWVGEEEGGPFFHDTWLSNAMHLSRPNHTAHQYSLQSLYH